MNYLTNNYNNKNNRNNNNNNDDDEEMMDGYLKQLRNVLEESSHYQRLANQMKLVFLFTFHFCVFFIVEWLLFPVFWPT